MSPLIKDLLVQGLLAGTAVKKAKKTSAGMAVYALAGVVFLIGFVFMTVAGYSALLENYPSYVAAAITGCSIWLVALAIGVSGYYSMNKRKIARKASFDSGMAGALEDKLKALLQGVEGPVKDNPLVSLVLAVLAGFAAGDHFGDKD